RVLAERRGDVAALDLLEVVRQRARLQDEGEVLRRLLSAGAHLDLGAAGDAVLQRRLRVVDVRRRLEHTVEDDRVVLRELLIERPRLAGEGRREFPALVLGLRDVLERLRAVMREPEEDDRLARRRVEVGTRPGRGEVLPGEL